MESNWIKILDVRLSKLILLARERKLTKNHAVVLSTKFWIECYLYYRLFRTFYRETWRSIVSCSKWSQYKHHKTAKYLVGVTPQGTINFISKGYGGRVSDKYITEDCGYLQKLQPQDVVLADRGFNVEDSIAYRATILHLPEANLSRTQKKWNLHVK